MAIKRTSIKLCDERSISLTILSDVFDQREILRENLLKELLDALGNLLLLLEDNDVLLFGRVEVDFLIWKCDFQNKDNFVLHRLLLQDFLDFVFDEIEANDGPAVHKAVELKGLDHWGLYVAMDHL